jgi:pimeloyl-ACP methyl ester carboxylesterase
LNYGSKRYAAMTATRQTLSLIIDGVRLHAEQLTPPRSNRKTVLVLLHDSLGAVSLWRDFPERVADATGFRVLAYDRRGHGASDPFDSGVRTRTAAYHRDEAAVLDRVLESVGAERAVIFGHSDGGTIALLAAALHPSRIASVIAEAAHVFAEERTRAGIREAQRAIETGDLLRRLERYHGDKAAPLAAAWVDTWLSPAFRDWNIEAELRRIRCPVLALQGSNDEYGTEAQVLAITRGVAYGSRSIIFPGLGHVPHREDPDAVVSIVADFVAGKMVSHG